MKTTTQLLLYTALIICFSSCEEDDEPPGKVNITLDANDAFKQANTDITGSTTKVVWGCLVLDEETTACIFYFNGEQQVDGTISAEALAAGPGSSGFTFVAPNTTFQGLEGGERQYSHFFATYDNNSGNTIDSPVNLSGEFDLYANIGEDVDWVVTFGGGANPTANNR